MDFRYNFSWLVTSVALPHFFFSYSYYVCMSDRVSVCSSPAFASLSTIFSKHFASFHTSKLVFSFFPAGLENTYTIYYFAAFAILHHITHWVPAALSFSRFTTSGRPFSADFHCQNVVEKVMKLLRSSIFKKYFEGGGRERIQFFFTFQKAQITDSRDVIFT